MTRIIIKKLLWDDWNKEHIKKHNLSIQEIEEAAGNLIAHKKSYKGRYIIIARSKKRLISIVVSRKKENTYYIVTARDSDRKERKKAYEKEKQNS